MVYWLVVVGGEINIWNVNTGIVIRTLTGHTDWIYSLVVLPDGLLASGCDDDTIRIWNFTTGINIKTLTGHSHDVRSLVVLSLDLLASSSFDQTIRIWS